MPMKDPDPGCDICRSQPMPADGWHPYLGPDGTTQGGRRCPRWAPFPPRTAEQQLAGPPRREAR